MSRLSFTRSQSAAITTLDRSVCVSAGAGSGKTEVLVRRFCHIVEENRAAAEEILTVTFTEKAAREMKERIVRRFEELGREKDRRAVESAYIGTIHSFCMRVLKENSIRAQVDPNFSVLDEASSLAVAAKAFNSTLESFAGDADAEELVVNLGTSTVKSAVTSLYGHIRSLGLLPSPRLVADPVPSLPYREMLERCINNLPEPGPDSSAALVRVLEGIREGLPAAEEDITRLCALQEEGRLDWESFIRLKEYISRFKLNAGGRDVQEKIKRAKGALTDLIGACLDCESSRYANTLLALTSRFHELYGAAKISMGALDYNDLLTKTRDLFIREDGGLTEIALAYKNRFRFISIDEFQDTNRLQKQIIDAVARPDNIFTVGDIKQSIYSFMYSDVDVFKEHQKSARVDKKRWAVLPFQENFRSRNGIIEFVNAFFERVWGEEAEFDFESLKCAGRFADSPSPNVEVVMVPKTPPDSTGRGSLSLGRANEAEAVAARILEITGKENPLFHTKEGRAGQAVSFGDIVLLLRSTESIGIYERALDMYGIPSYVVSGRGFYRTHEVQDILSLLSVVDNPGHDLAMAAVLRSPFVGISDDALFWLSRDWANNAVLPGADREPGKLMRGLLSAENITRLSEQDRRKLLKFRQLLKSLAEMRATPVITDIIEQAVQHSNYDIKLLTMRGGRRRLLNVRKLSDVAGRFQETSIGGLTEFIRYVKEQQVLAERETEAAAESEEGNVVRIMTIHKAKGLQAPVVFVADMSRSLSSGTGLFAFHPEHGLAMKVRNPLTWEMESSLTFAENAERIERKSFLEEKRLLYVAMTRAEEHLVLVGCTDLKVNARHAYCNIKNWTGWLEKALAITPGTANGVINRDGFFVDFKRCIPAAAGITNLDRLPISARYRKSLQSGERLNIDISPAAARIADEVLERCTKAAVPPAKMAGRLSVSQVLDYSECPARYHLLYDIGIPEEDIDIDYAPIEAGEYIGAADLGMEAHRILSELDFGRSLQPQIEAMLEKLGSPALRDELAPLMQNFAESTWAKELAEAEAVIKERPFELKVGGTILAGRMDVVFGGPGGWTVLDYKTGRGDDTERYRFQVGIYAHAAFGLLKEPPARTAVFNLRSGKGRSEDAIDGSIARLAAERVIEIAKGVGASRFIPTPGNTCAHCRLSLFCRKDLIPGK